MWNFALQLLCVADLLRILQQSEFCPPLDTSLVAALLSELQVSNNKTMARESLEQLRETLRMLSLHATEDESSTAVVEDSTDAQISSKSTSTEDTDSLFDQVYDTSSSSGSSMLPSNQSQSSAFAFLQASFPNMAPEKITSVIASSSFSSPDNGDFIDMERIVEHLLSEEYVRELEERGLAFDDEADLDNAPESWQIVGKNMKKRLHEEASPKAAPRQWKKKGKGVTVTLTDVRQQHRAAKVPQKTGANSGGGGVGGTVDPWNQISSLGTHLNSLLPDHSVAFFQSYFHSPKYSCPSDALRAALQEISSKNAISAEGNEEDATFLVPILEILIPQSGQNADLDRDESAQIVADATLALSAAGGSPESVIDIVNLLKELDADVSSVQYSRGVYHSSTQASSSTSFSARSSSASAKSTRSSSTSLSFSTKQHTAPVNRQPPSSSLTLHSTINSVWHNTKPKPPKGPSMPTHAAFIPALDPTNVPKRGKGRVKSTTLSQSNGVKGSSLAVSKQNNTKIVPATYAARIGECRTKRDEALREASRYWQRGTTKTRGGEVAMFYAERVSC
jgi:Arc/MetJ-type ribon-helix-helix transcriptional regulator